MKGTRKYLKNRHILTIGLALLLLLLAACGTNAASTSTTTGSGNGLSGSATTMPTVSGTEKCGTVHTLRMQVVPADKSHAQNNENCFWQAYQQCHPAMLTYSQGSLDTIMLHAFSLKSQNGQCVITDTVQRSVLPRTPTLVGSYTCSSLTQQNDGLHFSACGKEGNVLVPSAGTE